jgi:hypothetical protein
VIGWLGRGEREVGTEYLWMLKAFTETFFIAEIIRRGT